MSSEQRIQEREENFVTQLKEHARRQHVPIEETLWDHPTHADAAELRAVSNHRSYRLSLQLIDLTDPQRSKELVVMLLTAIRHSIPFLRVRREKRDALRGVFQ
jgi:hypothetical protein